ncbi:hypothetical protein JZ751_020382 [Albula glossodonta]|uniref:Uncharacterized protein n=1 Tax=Albula glossodonta TaxID=121402 RepID=A0A8T2NNJ5_9TELE|nr:hypothetical protein JZ751_020382 [Albula glossodonta]
MDVMCPVDTVYILGLWCQCGTCCIMEDDTCFLFIATEREKEERKGEREREGEERERGGDAFCSETLALYAGASGHRRALSRGDL